jgi:hypothetical protein
VCATVVDAILITATSSKKTQNGSQKYSDTFLAHGDVVLSRLNMVLIGHFTSSTVTDYKED